MDVLPYCVVLPLQPELKPASVSQLLQLRKPRTIWPGALSAVTEGPLRAEL